MLNEMIMPFCEDTFIFNIAQWHGVIERETLK